MTESQVIQSGSDAHPGAKTSRRRLLRRGVLALAVSLAGAACGSYGDTSVPGGYAFPKQRPSSDDFITEAEREALRQKARQDNQSKGGSGAAGSGG